MHALRRLVHVVVGFARRVVPLVMLARPRQRGEFAMHGVCGCGLCRTIGGVERQRRRAGERRAHHRDRAEHVRPDQRAPGRDRAAEIMADHGIDGAIAESGDQPERVAHEIRQAERGEVAVVIGVPSRGAAIAALVRRDDVIAGFGKRQHHLAPAIGKLRKAVQQQEARAAACLEAGLQHVHGEAVDVLDGARTDG